MGKYKQLIIGLALGAFLTTSCTIFADSVKYILEKSNSKIIVNGNEYSPKNNILTYNGITYLPLRDVGEALNLSLNYNDGVITINQKATAMKSNLLVDESFSNQDKHVRTPEETEQLIKDNNIPTDSDLAKELRDNPDSTLGTSYVNPRIEEKEVTSVIENCIDTYSIPNKEVKSYSNMSISKSINAIVYIVNNEPYFIKYENIPKDTIGEIKIVDRYDSVSGTTRGGFINGSIYIDKDFLNSLKIDY